MPTGRSHLFALLSAVVALVPGMAIGGSVDVHVTAAVPAPDAPQAPGEMQPAPPPASIAQPSGFDPFQGGLDRVGQMFALLARQQTAQGGNSSFRLGAQLRQSSDDSALLA